MSNEVVEAALQRIRSVANRLRAPGMIWNKDRAAFADGLVCMAGRIEAACSDSPIQLYCPPSPVSEFIIDFVDGTISGICSICTPAEVADALMRITAELQMMDDTPNYFCFDEGKVSTG